jgi:hypothetical protein
MEDSFMYKRRRIPSLALALFVLLSTLVSPKLTAQSSLVSTDDLSRRAEVVAIGKVTELRSEWNETHTMIRTRVTVSVDQYIKGGTRGTPLTLYVPGGEVGGVGEVYSDMPAFRPDEEVVVFAERDTQNHYRISAGPQGKLTVTRDKVTGIPMVSGGRTLETLKNEVKHSVEIQIDKQ